MLNKRKTRSVQLSEKSFIIKLHKHYQLKEKREEIDGSFGGGETTLCSVLSLLLLQTNRW